MAVRGKEELRVLFETGKIPTGQNFTDFIDSYIASINGNMPNMDGNVEVPIPFTVNPGIPVDGAPNLYPLGRTIGMFNYVPGENAFVDELFEGFNIPATTVTVITDRFGLDGRSVIIQQTDIMQDGAFIPTLTRSSNMEQTEWGPLQFVASVRSINGMTPNINGEINIDGIVQGLQVTDTVETFEELPTASNDNKGQVYVIDGKIYISNGTEWIDSGNLQGPRGETGPIGPTGANGANGDKGEMGEKGMQGVQGEQGAKGDKGDKGDKGERGDVGPAGQQGPEGPQGNQGVEGPEGPQGPKGDKGEDGKGPIVEKTYSSLSEATTDIPTSGLTEGQYISIVNASNPDENGSVYILHDGAYVFQFQAVGIKGEKGDTGEQGIQGQRGPQGPTGSRGPQGIPGEQGARGDKGEKGDGIVLKGEVASEGNLPSTGVNGDAYWANGILYIWSDDPALVSEPGFIRGSSLIGPMGPQGVQGPTPTLNNATTTNKGVVQVGNGLKVNEGILSVDNSKVNFTELSANSPFSDYPEGLVSKRIPNSGTDPEYIYLANVVKDLIGTDLLAVGNGNYFRIIIETTKIGSHGSQNVKFFTNFTAINYPVFELNRGYSLTTNEWNGWYANVIENYGKGDPNGRLSGFYGTKYTDVVSNITYIKKGSTNTTTNSGWVPINAPKEYWYASGSSPSTWTQSTSNTRLTMGQTLIRGIAVSGNTFTLKGGKVYKIDISFAVTTAATSGVIRIGIFNASTNSAADGNKIAIGTGANDKGNKSSTTSIIAPSVDTSYYVGIEANSPGGTFQLYSQNMTIVEI